MALKWLFFFPKKIARIVQRPGALPPGPHTCRHVQNVIVLKMSKTFKMALKWLFVFFRKKIARIAQAPIVGTYSLAHNLHNQQLSKSLLQGFLINKFNKLQLLP